MQLNFAMTYLLCLFEAVIFLSLAASMKVPNTCIIKKTSCSEQRCDLILFAYSENEINSVQWFHGEVEINNRAEHYTGSHNSTRIYCNQDIVCFETISGLTIKPFLPKDYGMYKAFLTTKDDKEIRCEAKFILKLSNKISVDTEGSGITVKTNYIYIAIGVLAGCILLIIILLASVIHLVRRNRGKRETNPSKGTMPSTRKYSNEQSHHTYASISSDIIRYESLMGRRGTRDGYENPAQQVISEDQEADEVATVPPELEDDISDFSIAMDSAFSSSSLSLETEDPPNNPQYSTENFKSNIANIHFNNGEYQESFQEKEEQTRVHSRNTEMSHDYLNIKKTRRLT